MKLEVLPPAEPFAVPAATAHGSGVGKSIQIVNAFFLRGPSIWTYRPALEAWLDIGELEDFPSNTIPGFYVRLSSWLPTLIEHRCGIGERGGFLQRLRDGTWPAHIMEHVMIELQNLAGIATGFGKAREASRRGVYKLVVRTPNAEIGHAALHLARDLVMAAINDEAFDVDAAVAQLRRVAADHAVEAGNAALAEAAAAQRIPVIASGQGKLLQLGQGARQRRVWAGEIAGTSAIAQGIAADKALSKRLLQSCGVPVAHGQCVDSADEAWEVAQELGLPVAIKPCEGSIGPVRKLLAHADVEAAYRAAYEIDSAVLVERFIEGSSHRLLVVGSRVVAAALCNSSNDAAVPEAVELAAIHPDTVAAAVLAARVVGLEIAGIDVVAADLSHPLGAQGGAIVGIDSRPGLHLHAHASEREQDAGTPAQAILAHLFGPGQGRIPVVGITGSHGTTPVATLLARLLRHGGSRVGLACADGLSIDARRLDDGDCANWEGAQRVLRNPAVDAAVIENGARSILSEGLGYDRCAVGIVTHIDVTDVLPEYDINDVAQMTNVIRTQVDVVLPDGMAVLNAADARVAALAPLCDGEVIFFAANADCAALTAHRAAGGRAVFLHDGQIVFASGHASKAIPLPAASRALRDPEHVLAAAGAAWALGVAIEVIGLGLQDVAVREGSAAVPVLRQAVRHARAYSTRHHAQSRNSQHGNISHQGLARP